MKKQRNKHIFYKLPEIIATTIKEKGSFLFMNNSQQNLVFQAEKIIENYSKKRTAEKKGSKGDWIFFASAVTVIIGAAIYFLLR